MNPDDTYYEDWATDDPVDDSYMEEEAETLYDDATLLKVGKSMVDDIDDRINSEFMQGEPSVEITAQSSKRFRVIPEE